MIKKKEAQIVNIECPAKAEFAGFIRSTSSFLVEGLEFSREKREDLSIAIGEACVNVIRHAYNGNASNNNNVMTVRFLIYPKKLVVITKDFGRGFDLQFVQRYIKRADAIMPEKVGLGIFLIKTLMDEVEYDSSIDKGTQVRMTKYR